jgi:hypothetical protein
LVFLPSGETAFSFFSSSDMVHLISPSWGVCNISPNH